MPKHTDINKVKINTGDYVYYEGMRFFRREPLCLLFYMFSPEIPGGF